MRIVILTPPRDTSRPDREDTFVQADEITTSLEALGHETLPAIFGSDRARTAAELRRLDPDVVFNLVEDLPEGPDQLHLATALLDRMELPYTGARTGALEALGDKRRMKAALREEGLPVPGDTAPRLIVKSAIEHASIGLGTENVVDGPAAAALIAARTETHGGSWFAEAYIEGREFNVSVLQTGDAPRVLPAAEIRFVSRGGEPRILGYAEKWDTGSNAYAATPRVFPPREEPLFSELERLSLAAWRLFSLTGYARIDFRVDGEGQPYILEVNANPCLAADAGFCAAAERAGLGQHDVVAAIVAAAR